ncbi:MAG: Uma2 family endonuclease [Planctomycetes bacterium]|nr:Uma2 family endonuclease [Planctomycetota bacterium]
MGETDLHRWWMFRLIHILEHRYRNQRVYVSGNLMVYYEEGQPRKSVAPDAFVVKDCDPGFRRVFKIWQEGRRPNAVFEVTSRSTKPEDLVFKPKTYAHIQVAEYFLYDPTAEYLRPPLQGHRLEGGDYCPIEPDATGALVSEELDLLLRLEGSELVLFDRTTGERQLTPQEAAEQAARAASQRANAVEERAQAAEERADAARERAAEAEGRAAEAERTREAERAAREAAEAELERLRQLLRGSGEV